MTWQLDAACTGQTSMVEDTTPEGIAHNLTVCAGCPVVTQCLDWARSEPMFEGVAGGRYWANGQQKTPPKVKRRPLTLVDEEWSADAMRAAHAAFWRGDRDPWAVAGERAYNRTRKRRTRPRPTGRQLQPCGTDAAYKRHLLRGEVPCDGCVEARRDYQRRSYRRRTSGEAAA